jgi:hypothetical protein
MGQVSQNEDIDERREGLTPRLPLPKPNAAWQNVKTDHRVSRSSETFEAEIGEIVDLLGSWMKLWPRSIERKSNKKPQKGIRLFFRWLKEGRELEKRLVRLVNNTQGEQQQFARGLLDAVKRALL